LSADWENYADGRILSGTQAKDLGFVDEIGDFDVAVNRAQTLAKTGKANLVEYQQVFDLSDLLHLFGHTDVKKINLDWGVDLPKLRPGCAYYLMSPYSR
jgi:protease-4